MAVIISIIQTKYAFPAIYIQNSAQSFEDFTNEMATKAEIGSMYSTIFFYFKKSFVTMPSF